MIILEYVLAKNSGIVNKLFQRSGCEKLTTAKGYREIKIENRLGG